MKTVVVVGATGSVGTELSLVLAQMSEIRVIAVCRSDLAAAFLRRCGVECRVGDPRNPVEAQRLLEGADVVVDLTLPVGPEPQARRLNLQLVDSLLAATPSGAAFVFASTYMVLGVKDPGDRLRWRRLAGTSYGARKRLLEKRVTRWGRQEGRDVYVFRLGQVHGELQRVSDAVTQVIGRGAAVVPAGASNTVFVSTIAEGVRGVALGQEHPGTYDLVSRPQLTWLELHAFLARRAAVTHPARVETVVPRNRGRRVRSLLLGLATKRRELIVGYLLPRMPDRESRLRGQHLVRSALGSLAAMEVEERPFAFVFTGEVPGPFLRTPSDPRASASQYGDAVRVSIRRALEQA